MNKIPTPTQNESEEEFISRCCKSIGDTTELRDEYKDIYHEHQLMIVCNKDKMKAKYNQTIIKK